VQASQDPDTAARRVTPVWLWGALLAGAVVTAWWAWFIFGFVSEPSAVGGILAVLLYWIAMSIGSGFAGAVGAVGLLRHQAWGRPLAWIAAIAMTLTGVGAVAGIPALIGLVSSRNASRP
jgi:hypothetical protein